MFFLLDSPQNRPSSHNTPLSANAPLSANTPLHYYLLSFFFAPYCSRNTGTASPYLALSGSIRAQNRPISLPLNTGSKSPYFATAQYGLKIALFRYRSIRALAHLCAHFVARIRLATPPYLPLSGSIRALNRPISLPLNTGSKSPYCLRNTGSSSPMCSLRCAHTARIGVSASHSTRPVPLPPLDRLSSYGYQSRPALCEKCNLPAEAQILFTCPLHRADNLSILIVIKQNETKYLPFLAQTRNMPKRNPRRNLESLLGSF